MESENTVASEDLCNVVRHENLSAIVLSYCRCIGSNVVKNLDFQIFIRPLRQFYKTMLEFNHRKICKSRIIYKVTLTPETRVSEIQFLQQNTDSHAKLNAQQQKPG